jgi:inorganic triphosphatase YgiF
MAAPPVSEATRREIELRLEAPREVVEAAFRHPLLRSGAEGHVSRESVRSLYFDTEDSALRREGIVLQLRSTPAGTLQTLREEQEPVAGLFTREASEALIASDVPDPGCIAGEELRTRVQAACGERCERLHPVAETEVARVRQRVEREGARVEAVLDVGELRVASGAAPIAELELGLREGEPAALYDLALALQEELPSLRPARESERARTLAQLASEAPRIVPARGLAIAADASLDAWLSACLADCASQIHANEAAARAALAEGVHQMRVGTRRARSLLKLLRDALPAESTEELRGELRWLAETLGRARDWDVLIADVLRPLRELEPSLGELTVRAEERRAGAYADLRAALDEPRFGRLMLLLGRFATGGPWRAQPLSPDSATLFAPARGALAELLDRGAKRVRKASRRLGERSPDELHRLRLRVKDVRYAADLAAPLFGRPARRFAKRAARLQDALGARNDAAAAQARVAQLAGSATDGPAQRAAGFALGWLARTPVSQDELEWRRRRLAKAMGFWE